MIVKFSLFTLLAGVTGLVACKASRAGYESPDYKTARKDGKFEVREYGEMVVASARMDGGDKDNGGGFNKLFKYISGKNEAGRKIAMTTPVFIDEKNDEMQFVLPKKVAEEGPPAAAGTPVGIKTVKGGKFAVLRFTGYRSDAAGPAAVAQLKSWIRKNGLTAVGEPVFAYYDPPWTPEKLRRNEVLIRVRE